MKTNRSWCTEKKKPFITEYIEKSITASKNFQRYYKLPSTSSGIDLPAIQDEQLAAYLYIAWHQCFAYGDYTRQIIIYRVNSERK